MYYIFNLEQKYNGNSIFYENYAWLLLPGELSIIGIVWLNALQFDNPSKRVFSFCSCFYGHSSLYRKNCRSSINGKSNMKKGNVILILDSVMTNNRANKLMKIQFCGL